MFFSRFSKLTSLVLAALCLGLTFEATAGAPVVDDVQSEESHSHSGESDWFSLHGQSTYIWQQKDNFRSSYYGQNSLTNRTEGGGGKSYTWSVTGFFGTRLWEGAEAYYNPEMFEGTPFTGSLVGLGGIQNGELQKGSFAPPTYYNARAFLKQTIGLGGGKIHLDSGPNQIAGEIDKNRIVLSYGKVASLDYFDQNTYSHDPRTQFQNFALWSMGAFGYAADSKGYTYGVVGEWYQDDFVLRTARLAVTTQPGGTQLDWTLRQNYVDTLEVTHNHEAWGRPGAIRLLVYRQYANMATYNNALSKAISPDLTPTPLTDARSFTNSWGYGINAEQAITNDVGVFGRWSWNPGQTETLTLDMSRSLSGGASVKGNRWGRSMDTVGVGYAINGISASEINYLSKGYYTVFIGDSQIQYRTEQVGEAYYSAQICKGLSITGDYQHISNPAYNSARGPVNFFGFRIHGEI